MAHYRSTALRCPACDEILEEQLRGQTQVDICPRCQGLYLDWHDGEIATVVDEVGSLPRPRGGVDGGRWECPHCAVPMDYEAIEERDVTIRRCGTCAGVFLTRQAFDLLSPVPEPPDDEEPAGVDPFLTRVLDVIGRWLTPGA
ncbi:MAG: zf-TFIIB domain-containing protein [Myxococcales bacterium]|nr:zf-TFIIB domain-containing protein [Myxococcales bacterium]